MKRIMLIVASGLILYSADANAQLGKQGTQRPSPGSTNRNMDNRQQPGTWQTNPERREREQRINPTRQDAPPATIRSGNSPRSGTSYSPQDTIRRRRDTVEGPVPIPIPPAPIPVPIPDTIRR